MEPNEDDEERQGNDKKAERLAKRRERNDNVCSRRLLRKGKQRLVFTTLCTNDTVAIQVEV
jgi:hypothetical protein